MVEYMEPGEDKRNASEARTSHHAVQVAMRAHYRDKVNDSVVSYSPAWKEAKVAIRFLNHVSPLMLGVIQRPGSNADMEERKKALTFLTTSTDALASVMSGALAPTQELKEYDRIELNSVLTHVVGNMWERSAKQDPQAKIDELLKTVAAVYRDEQFLANQNAMAVRMMDASGYLKVDSKETMETRLRLSMHNAVMRFYAGVVDERVCNGKGVPFTYGLTRIDLVRKITEQFDGVTSRLFAQRGFHGSLSNDQRTSVMQSWLRNAADIFQAEYVAQTVRKMDWFRAGQAISEETYSQRFAIVKDSIDEVVGAVAEFTEETMSDLLDVAQYQGEHPKEEASEVLTSAPRQS